MLKDKSSWNQNFRAVTNQNSSAWSKEITPIGKNLSGQWEAPVLQVQKLQDWRQWKCQNQHLMVKTYCELSLSVELSKCSTYLNKHHFRLQLRNWRKCQMAGTCNNYWHICRWHFTWPHSVQPMQNYWNSTLWGTP